MKYLTDYTDKKTTELLDECGAFFAFSNKQFDEAKQEGVKYVSMGAGLICPKDNASKFAREFDAITSEGMKQDLAENGRSGVIHRELGNHEYCITMGISETVWALDEYGITEDEIRAETGAYLKAHYEWEEAQEAKAVTV